MTSVATFAAWIAGEGASQDEEDLTDGSGNETEEADLCRSRLPKNKHRHLETPPYAQVSTKAVHCVTPSVDICCFLDSVGAQSR